MDIRSTSSGTTPKTQAQRARDTAPANASRPGASPPAAGGAPVDRVELSPEARELNARAARDAAADGLPADRLAAIAERLRSGYYDRPDVVERMLARLSDEFRAPSQG